MNATRNLTLALGLAAILAAPTFAQRPGGPGGQGGQGRFGGGMGMQGSLIQTAMAPPVHEELGLSDEQVEQLRPIGEQYRSEMMSRMQEARGQFGDLSPEERRERMEQMSLELNASARDQLQDVLNDEQLDRLEQIHLQQQGVQAFATPRVREELKLDDAQQAKIDEVLGSYRSESRALMENARNAQNRGQVMQQMMDLRRSTMDEALGVLTDEQRATWNELTGEPFELGPGGPGGRRGGPGGRQGGPGGRPGGRPPVRN